GLFFGAGVGGVLYGRFAQQAGTPAVFWAIMSAVALVTVAALVIYNRFITPPVPVAEPVQKRRRGAFGALGAFGVALLALLMVPALIVAAGAIPGSQPVESASASADDGGLDAANLATLTMPQDAGTAAEGEVVTKTITLPDNATGTMTLTLAWTDEAAGTPTGTNAPDTFKIHVMKPDGTMVESEESSSGELEFVVEGIAGGAYEIGVELVNAGDVAVLNTPLGPAPVGGSADSGNDYTLDTAYQATA
ncbi:MAG TPA: hypothetical protein VM370_05005, partial [Candidatus Thermoplasmatota archaeon]|nr:hypothetical protein [Candidatus Thermoplasmatota archaeon]